jgi:hypothetical protein
MLLPADEEILNGVFVPGCVGTLVNNSMNRLF